MRKKYVYEHSKFIAMDSFINQHWKEMNQETLQWCLGILRQLVDRINEEK